MDAPQLQDDFDNTAEDFPVVGLKTYWLDSKAVFKEIVQQSNYQEFP